MNKALKIIGIGFMILLAIPVVLYIVVVLNNLRDDDLDPEAAKLLASAPPQISAEENGYFAWVGVVGPEAESPHAWGKRWFAEVLAADKKSNGVEQDAALAIERERRRDTLTSELVPCNKSETCLEEVAAQRDFARAALAKGRVTLERCDLAIAYPAYQEAWRPDFSLTSAPISYPAYWRQLSATRFALAVAEARHDEALDQLGREMAFHTRQMQGAFTLIEKLVALTYLRNDYQLLNRYLLRYPAAARPRAVRIAVLLAPLPPDAASLQRTMEAEWRFAARLSISIRDRITSTLSRDSFDDSQEGSLGRRLVDRLAFPLFLPTATANELYHQRRPLFSIDSRTGAAYRLALAELKQQRLLRSERSNMALRNPIGHLVVVADAPSFDSYFMRRDDLLVLRSAVLLQLDLLRQGESDEAAITRTIAAIDLIHPFTGATPTWDGRAHTLTYPASPERRNEPLVIHF